MSALLLATACAGAAGTTASRPPTTEGSPSAEGSPVAPTTVASRTVAPPVTVAPAPLSPLTIAATTIDFVDRSRPTVSGGKTLSRSRALTTRVWYPATGGPWPLVVFAHGFSVGPDPYVALCQAWAAAGYVVAAPEFPLTDSDVAGAVLDEDDIQNQPDDVRFLFAALTAAIGPLAARIDKSRLGVAGHSDGGTTALAVAAEPPDGLRGVIALSASPVDFGAKTTPILVVHGEADGIDPYAKGQTVYQDAAAPRFLLTLLGGGHLEPFLASSDWIDLVDRTAVDFLDRYVAGRSTSVDALLADGEPGLATIDADP